MDEVDRLISAYRARTSASVAARMALLMEIAQLHDARAVSFLLNVLSDGHEAAALRIYVLKQLRNARAIGWLGDRGQVAKAIGDTLLHASHAEIRVHAALLLGEFTESSAVLTTLSAICVKQDESIDLRYAAFTSLERAGPTAECIALLREIASDETLGLSARSVLSAWRIQT